MKLMILDGNSVINRAFYGVRALTAQDGTPTNAVYGFLNIYRKLMTEVCPDAVCVAFDRKEPTFRHIRYPAYKAQRKGMPEELAVQMPLMKDVLDAMNVRRYELSGWEADDIIGTVSLLCEAKGWDCSIVTGDRDSFQLISDRTHVLHVRTHMGRTETNEYDTARFAEEYGFTPEKIVDLKALMGDASDNIPGVAGIGEKTASDLVRRFGTVEDIYARLDTLDIRDSVRKKLADGRESAELSFELAEIRRDAPIDFLPEDAGVREVDNDGLYRLFRRLDFRRLIETFGLAEPAAAEDAGEKTVFSGECASVEVTDGDTLARMKEQLSDGTVFVRFSGDMSVTAAERGGTAFILRSGSPVYEEAMRFLCSSAVRKAGHDIKDSMRALLGMGFGTEGWIFDSALAAYLLDPTADGYALASLAERRCGVILRQLEDDGQLRLPDQSEEAGTLADEAAAVACLREKLLPELENNGLLRVFEDIELPLCPVLASMEAAGIIADRSALEAFGAALSEGTEGAERAVYEMAGETFNINSPKQLGAVLFEKLMLPAPKKTKTGYSTSAEVLEKLIGKHPIIEQILEYRELSKLKSTYAEGLLRVIAPDGRIHTTYQMTVTATGRLSSTDPNLQNIPVRRELGGEFRKMFVAAPGCVLVDADYSQIELRLLAHMSGDETMIRAFAEGEDIHRVTASQVFDTPLAEVTPTQRGRAKAVNFGIVYGISQFSLAKDVGVSVAEAKRYMDSYLEKYHGVRDYMKRVVEDARRDGYVSTLYGRRRWLPELHSSNFNIRSFGERVALNMPVQGTAADIMKLAMIRAVRRFETEGLRARLLLQIHDELIAECPEDEAETVRRVLCEEMEHAASLSVPLTVSAGVGRSWHDAK